MRGCARLLCIVGLLLIGGGIFVGGAEVGFACFDVCPPSLTAYSAFYVFGSLLPGVIAAGLGWAFTLLLLIQEEQRWRTVVTLAALPICLIGSALAVLVSNSGHLLPGSEGEIIRWERSLTAVLILLPCWPLVTFLCTIALPHQEATHASAPRM